ncbi:MAG: hypothetical protein IPM14_10555 [bacterium]|nr:hypothetical protein [bacterium]
MLIKITFPVMLLLFINGICNAQYFESVNKEAERILISLSDGDSLITSDFVELKKLLSSGISFKLSESSPDASQEKIDSLKNHLNEFELESKNISVDSAFVLFNDWYLHFQNIFYEFSKQKFFSSPKTKLLLFSTSMSCYCTLKMSRNQTVDLLKFISDNDDKYDYWIVDSYWYNELQIEYETLFAPSVVIMDGNNKVLQIIEYEEKMLSILTDYLKKVKN